MNPRSPRVMQYPLWAYLLLWLFFLYIFIQILSFQVGGATNSIIVIGMYFVEFGVHEASHLLAAFLPSIFVAAAGSFGEVGFTVLLLIATLRSKAYFAASFAGLWIMLALRSAGQYMADARSQAIPLIGPSETVKHDWNYVFGQLGWLPYDVAIGQSIATIGLVIGVLSLVSGLALIVVKILGSHQAK